jgi:hypothetical protein
MVADGRGGRESIKAEGRGGGGEQEGGELSSRLGVAGLWLAFACGCNVMLKQMVAVRVVPAPLGRLPRIGLCLSQPTCQLLTSLHRLGLPCPNHAYNHDISRNDQPLHRSLRSLLGTGNAGEFTSYILTRTDLPRISERFQLVDTAENDMLSRCISLVARPGRF